MAGSHGDSATVRSPGRSYVWQVLAAPPRRVMVENGEEIPQREGTTAGGAFWWHDGAHFLFVRTPAASQLTVEMEGAQL